MPADPPLSGAPSPADSVTYLDAIARALREEMREDPDVIFLGQDIAEHGGAFKLSAGMLEEFGAARVINTPIAESGTIGIAVGAALLGQRPVVEMQFADFASCGFNQLVNVAAKMRYRLERSVPLVVRLPSGGGVGAGPFHSQSIEGWFLHTPGLKAVAPAFPDDAYTLLRAAIRDPDPVLYFEHKYLYRRVKGTLSAGVGRAPSEPSLDAAIAPRARVVRRGEHVSVVSYGWMLHRALEAAALLEGEGISVEVVDLPVLAPLDEETIHASVERTGKVLVVHEATTSFGPGAEIVARIASRSFEFLDAPPERLGYPDHPVPFHPKLEASSLPDAEKIAARVRELARW